MPPESAPACSLCDADGGAPVWRGHWLRVIRADEPGLPAFYRVVWNAHVAEFTELPPLQRLACIDAVALTERVLREQLQPHKINLASLGNVVPHLHWHVIARWREDAHWPQPVWAPAQRAVDAQWARDVAARLPAVDAALAQALQRRFGS